MKLQEQRKKIAVDSIKLTGVVGAFIGLYIGISAWTTTVESSKAETMAQSTQQQGEIANLRAKIDSSGSAQKIFARVVEDRKNEQFEIDNERVRVVLQELVKRYRLSISDKLEYSAEKEFKHPELTTITTPIVVRQEAKLKFSAISDLHAYAFLQALGRELPGIVSYKQFKLTRKTALDADTISQLALGKAVYTVDVEVSFNWYGFKPGNASAEAVPPAAGAVP